jgi:hypothetical protein
LCEAVVVAIAELGVALFAPWTIQCLYSSCFLLLNFAALVHEFEVIPSIPYGKSSERKI